MQMNLNRVKDQVRLNNKFKKNLDNIDVQMLLKNIKTQLKVQEQHKAAYNLQKEKTAKRNKKADENRFINQQLEQDRIIKWNERQQARESRLINRKAEKLLAKALNCQHNEGEIQKDLLNCKGESEGVHPIQVHSGNHRNYIDAIKNNFYERNGELIIDQHKLFEDNLENNGNNTKHKGQSAHNQRKLAHNQKQNGNKIFEQYNDKNEQEVDLTEKDKAIINEYEKCRKGKEIELDIKKPKIQVCLNVLLTDEDIHKKMNELDMIISRLKNEGINSS